MSRNMKFSPGFGTGKRLVQKDQCGVVIMLCSTHWSMTPPHNITFHGYFNFSFLSHRLTTLSFNTLWIQQVNLLNILDKIRQQRTLLQGLQNT